MTTETATLLLRFRGRSWAPLGAYPSRISLPVKALGTVFRAQFLEALAAGPHDRRADLQ